MGSQCRRRGSTHRWCSRLRSGSSFRRPLPPPATPSTSNSASSHPTLTHPRGAPTPRGARSLASRHPCHLEPDARIPSSLYATVPRIPSHSGIACVVDVCCGHSSSCYQVLEQCGHWVRGSGGEHCFCCSCLFSSCRDWTATVDCNDAPPPIAWRGLCGLVSLQCCASAPRRVCTWLGVWWNPLGLGSVGMSVSRSQWVRVSVIVTHRS